MDPKDQLIAQLHDKIEQAHQTIRALLSATTGRQTIDSGEAARVLGYFSSPDFDRNFRVIQGLAQSADDGLRPEELNAANDD